MNRAIALLPPPAGSRGATLVKSDKWAQYGVASPEWKIETLQVPTEEVQKWFASQKRKFLGFRLNMDVADQLWSMFTQFPIRVAEMKTFDSLIWLDGELWAQSFIREALHELVVKSAPYLDITKVAYVAGVGGELRVAVSVAVQLGYRSVKVVHLENDVPADIKDLRRHYFGVSFEPVANVDLTLQTNDASLLINTFNPEIDAAVVADLSFLNFLSAGALVANLWADDAESSLKAEAENLEFLYLPGGTIAQRADELFLEMIKRVSQA